MYFLKPNDLPAFFMEKNPVFLGNGISSAIIFLDTATSGEEKSKGPSSIIAQRLDSKQSFLAPVQKFSQEKAKELKVSQCGERKVTYRHPALCLPRCHFNLR